MAMSLLGSAFIVSMCFMMKMETESPLQFMTRVQHYVEYSNATLLNIPVLQEVDVWWKNDSDVGGPRCFLLAGHRHKFESYDLPEKGGDYDSPATALLVRQTAQVSLTFDREPTPPPLSVLAAQHPVPPYSGASLVSPCMGVLILCVLVSVLM